MITFVVLQDKHRNYYPARVRIYGTKHVPKPISFNGINMLCEWGSYFEALTKKKAIKACKLSADGEQYRIIFKKKKEA